MVFKLIPAKTYARLVKTIQLTIATGRAAIQKAQAKTYWQVGKFISDYVLNGADRAKYGEHIFEHLEKDLKIDVKTLRQTVRFAQEFSIQDARPELTWTHFRSLLSLPAPSRKKFIKETIKKDLNSRELQKEIQDHKAKFLTDVESPKVSAISKEGPVLKLKFERGYLFTYKVIAPISLQAGEGYKFIDQGFDAWQRVPVAQLAKFEEGSIVESVKVRDCYKIKSSARVAKDLYTFKAMVERVVDGDTLLVHVDCGFDHWRREYLRFRGIDCPELSTPEGQKVKRFIESRIKPNDFVIIKTHKDDKYGRYLVDVWYAPTPAMEKDVSASGSLRGVPQSGTTKQSFWDESRVAVEGIYLNQELLDNRLAVGMKR